MFGGIFMFIDVFVLCWGMIDDGVYEFKVFFDIICCMIIWGEIEVKCFGL